MNSVNGTAAPVGDGALSLPKAEAVVAPKELPPELLEKLKAPLPPEAVSPNPERPGLSAIKVIYVVERLNEVFGMNGWHMANEVVEKGAMVVVKGTLTIGDYGIRIEQYGGNANSDRGDAYKGACTDALSKCASYIGIGMDVYKGRHDQRSTNHEYAGRSGNGRRADADKAVASLTSKNMAERFSAIRAVLGGHDYEAVLEGLGCGDMGTPDLGKAREAYSALLEVFRARYREGRHELGESEYRRILGELRLRATWRLRPEQGVRVFERMKERLYARR
jgi:hypothetical protein